MEATMGAMVMTNMMMATTAPSWAGQQYRYWGPIRSGELNRPIGTKVTVFLPDNYEIEQVMMIKDPNTQTFRIATRDDRPPCPGGVHRLVEQQTLTEVVFVRGSHTRTLYAERNCLLCGQYFFITTSDYIPFSGIQGNTYQQGGPVPTYINPGNNNCCECTIC
jgi:hypothetical protein